MGGDLPVEDEYLAPRRNLAEVIITPPVAQAELQDRAKHIADQFGRQVETGALFLEAANVDVEPAHAPNVLVLDATRVWSCAPFREIPSLRIMFPGPLQPDRGHPGGNRSSPRRLIGQIGYGSARLSSCAYAPRRLQMQSSETPHRDDCQAKTGRRHWQASAIGIEREIGSTGPRLPSGITV